MNKKPHSLQPHAKMLLSSLRSMGYTDETAISDIIDNSISSEASEIQIYFDWENQRIIIADNGNGMSSEELLNAMEIGSADPAVMRASEDLGRFGMGMKTASFSIGKSLYVISKQNSSVSNAEWDLDYVEKNDEWEVLIHPSESITEEIDSVSDLVDYSDWDQGTLIILSKLDKLIDENNIEKSKKKFYKTIKNISAHIAMIFHRFIEDNDLTIKVNGNEIKPWNPFVRYSPATMELTSEELFDGKSMVTIEPFILPHKNKFDSEEEYKRAGGIKDWMGQQGFYVYRNKRLIVYGTWFNKFKREPAYNLARIKLDMSSDSDFEWKIDIRKSKAVLPVMIEERITDIAYLAIEKSVAVYNSRGVYNRKNTANQTNLKYVWEQRKNSAGNYMFYLNKKHPMLLKIMQGLDDERQKELKVYLSLIENYSPSMLSGLMSQNSNYEVSLEEKERDILHIKEKIEVYRQLQFEDDEIYDTLADSPEYTYLKDELREIIEET